MDQPSVEKKQLTEHVSATVQKKGYGLTLIDNRSMPETARVDQEKINNSPRVQQLKSIAGTVIQPVLKINSSPHSPFTELKFKQFRALTHKQRMEVPVPSWINLRKMALSNETFEFNNWRSAVDAATPVVNHQEAVFDKKKARPGSKKSRLDKKAENKDKKNKVMGYLANLKAVRVGFVEGLAFGNIISGLTLIKSLQELGFQGKVTVVCSASILGKLKILKPDIEEMMTHEPTEDFSAEEEYAKPAMVEPDTLSFMANGDLVDSDTNLKILNFMKSDVCLIMNPYGWTSGNGRKLLQRPSKDAHNKDVQVNRMHEGIDKEALYSFSTDSPKRLSEYIRSQMKVGDAMADGIVAVTEAAKSNHVLLQPVYGLHSLEDENLINTEALLSEGVKQAVADSRPVVLLMLSNSAVDFIPPYTKKWLIRAEITDGNIGEKIRDMVNGQVMILRCPELPNTVFTQVFKLASLPPLIEGANTSNLVQIIGKPFMSAKTHTTKFPFTGDPQYKHATDQLNATKDALIAKSGINRTLEENELFVNELPYQKLLLYKITQLQGLIAVTPAQELKIVLKGDRDSLVNNINKLHEEDTYADLVVKLKSGDISIADLNPIKVGTEKKIQELKAEIKASLVGQDYGLVTEDINKIAAMIKDSGDKKSDLGIYFKRVAKSAKSGDRNQVLQGILMLLNHLPQAGQ